jgi:hypothetical protein
MIIWILQRRTGIVPPPIVGVALAANKQWGKNRMPDFGRRSKRVPLLAIPAVNPFSIKTDEPTDLIAALL